MNRTAPWLPWLPWVLALLALAGALTLAVAVGAVPIAPGQLLRAVQGLGDPTVVAVVRDLRAPRAVLAALVGAALAVSGGALQGTLRNPLAEPYLLGVSGGAAVGAVLAMALGVEQPLAITLAAFGGAAAATLLVTLLARVAGQRTDTRLLVMAGVVVGAFANAVILVALADAPPDRLRGALWWMMGSAVVLLGGGLVWWARDLDVLALGEEPAAALGVDVDRAARRFFLVASWLAAATVASAGLVGFVGLVVPAAARAAGARTHRPQLLLAALLGGALVVLADLAARVVRAPAELPLGAVTALVGVPFFLHRMRKAGA